MWKRPPVEIRHLRDFGALCEKPLVMKLMEVRPISKVAWVLWRNGWRRGRDCQEIVEAYRSEREQELFPAAESYLRQFGGLKVGHLMGWKTSCEDIDLTPFEGRISEVVNARIVPVGWAVNYMSCDSAVIWLDEHGRFYAADEEGMMYLSTGVQNLFEVLILGAKPGKPPVELRERLKAAWEWSDECPVVPDDSPQKV